MTAPLSLETRARLVKLVPMLSSPIAGEVAATAAAIERALKSAGSDWHDLAAHIERDNGTPVVSRDNLGHTTKPPSDLPPLFEHLKRSARLEWLGLATASDALDDFERGLCIGIRAQVFSQPHKTVTPKQCAAISTAMGKLWLAGVRV